jgi:hypothetical protein
MKIYKDKTVQDLEDFYGGLYVQRELYDTISSHLTALAERMWEGVQTNNEAVLKEINNYHPRYLGRPTAQLAKLGLTENDCKHTLAHEFGFRRWAELTHLNSPYDLAFENCIDTMLAGDFKGIKKIITGNNALLNQKSQYGHEATLLHYSASNGVELWRQKVPLNLPEMVEFLVENGANRNARMKVYGGEYTAAELLLSSAHPRQAGILMELRQHFPG